VKGRKIERKGITPSTGADSADRQAAPGARREKEREQSGERKKESKKDTERERKKERKE
jgi:hypothetical protein